MKYRIADEHCTTAVISCYSADLNYPDKTNKTWISERVFLKLG